MPAAVVEIAYGAAADVGGDLEASAREFRVELQVARLAGPLEDALGSLADERLAVLKKLLKRADVTAVINASACGVIEAARTGGERLYYWLDIHWTPAGNRVAAAAAAMRCEKSPNGGINWLQVKP